jgi:hypothetical protein
MASKKAWRLVGAIIILIGAILLIAALLTPWYAYETSFASGGSITQNSYLGMPSANGTIQYSCSSTLPPFPSCPSQTSYASTTPKETNVGNIAETGFFLLIVGIILGFLVTIFGFVARSNARRSGFAIALGVLALLLAIITPVLFVAALPSAISNDISSAYRPANTSGPWSSFMGSSSSPYRNPLNGGVSLNWGPALGWYLSIVAFVTLLIGVILLFIGRKESPAAATTSAPASTVPVSATTPRLTSSPAP